MITCKADIIMDATKKAVDSGMSDASIFGPVINTNTSRSFPWDLARTITFIKEVSKVSKVSKIPLHVDMGMGVGDILMLETPPIDAVTRANKAMVEMAGVDSI